MKGYTVLRWCRTVAALAACLAITASPAPTRAEEMLYPHAERVGGPWGYIDRTGKIVVPLQFDWAEPFSEGLAAVSVNKKLGYIDNAGRFIITPQYTGSLFTDASFRNGHAVVMDGKEARLIDRHDNIITVDRPGARIVPRMDPTLQQVEPGYRKPTDDDRIIIKSEKLGAIDLSGRTIIEPEYDRMEPFSEGLAAVYRGGKVGFVDRDGKLVIPIGIEGYSLRFLDGRAKVTKTQPWHHCGFIDRTGKLIIPDIYNDCQDFHEGRAAVLVKPQGWGIMDLEGRFVVPPQFTRVDTSAFPIRKGKPFGRGGFTSHGRGGFSEGLMAVSSKDGYGYIDRDGKLVIAHRFQAASLFHDGLAVVAAPAETGFGIPQGSLNLRNPNDGFFEGVIDRSGQFVVSPVYDWAKVRPGGLIHVRFGDRLGYLDSTGKPLTFPAQEIEEHVARKREQLQPPPPGRAVVAKAGDTSYYLHLPDGWCAFDPSVPQDKQVLDDLWAENAAKLEDARKKLPLVTEQEWRNTQKLIDDVRLKVSVLTGCDQLEAIRSGRDKTALRTFAVANGLHKDRYEPSVNGGLLMRVARACTDSLGAPPPKDHSARIWTAFKRLEAGESTQLPALVLDGYACFSAVVTPAESGAGAGPQTHAKAKVGFHTLFVLPNWGVEMHTEETIAATPDALLQALDKQRALIQPFGKANLKRP